MNYIITKFKKEYLNLPVSLVNTGIRTIVDNVENVDVKYT